MNAIGNIHLVWKRGSRRYCVGIIKRNATQGVRFQYDLDEVKEAKKQGFTPY